MSSPITSLAQVLAPMTPETFFAEYFGRKPCYIPGPPNKFRSVMTWDGLTDLANMTALWSSETLVMVMDTQPVPAREYCRPGVDRRQGNALMVDPDRVMALMRRGASVVLNRIDGLTPGLRAVSRTLEEALVGTAQVNLYCSWEKHKAFRPHEDDHDVFALHCEGEKDWVVYEGRAPLPIPHPQYRLSPEQREQAKGRPLLEVTLTPGDLLYIPRGQLHDALAREGCVHVACGLNYPIGMDLLNLVWEQAMRDPLFRSDVPAPGARGGTAADQRAFLKEAGQRLAALMDSDDFQAAVTAFQHGYAKPRDGFRFPVGQDRAAAE